LSPGERSTPEETSTAPAPETRTASGSSAAVRPPDSIHGSRHSRPAISRQSNASPLPPGKASARRGGLASNSSMSASSSYRAAASTSSGPAMAIAFMIGRRKRRFAPATRPGLSLPWNCRRSSGTTSSTAAIAASSASTNSPTRRTSAATASHRRAACAGPTARGLGG
jgi:hypothetical protein